MQELLAVTATGRARWHRWECPIQLATRTTTRWTASGDQAATSVAYEVRFDAPELSLWRFGSESERGASMVRLLSDLAVEPASEPTKTVEHALVDAVGQRLAILNFVWDYVQLRFEEGEGPSPLNLYVMPRVRRGESTLRPGDHGYADALVGLIGTRLVSVDEVLDLGLVLAFDGETRLTIPLDGTDMVGPEVAECFASKSSDHTVWRPGDEPIEWLPELA